MRNLEIDYPKVGAGIDFAPILANTPKDPKSFESMKVLSASGRPLNVQIGQNYLYLSDARHEDSRYCMEASADRNRIVRFSLFTRLPIRRDGLQTPVHPDFFAGKFVGVALAHIQRYGYVDGITSEWGDRSVGYASFMEAYEKTGDKIGSAKKTWSWKTFSKHGFSIVQKVKIDIDPPWPTTVEATFVRPR